jgi:hypothetical protein
MITTLPVVKAMPPDHDEVMDICRQDHSENGQFSFSLRKVDDTISRILNENAGVIGIIRRHNTIESIVVMQIGQFWYTDDFCLEETLNYVRPPYRKSTNAKDMIQFGKRSSDELKIPLVIGVVSNERTQAKMALYERQLGKPVGGYFIHIPARSDLALAHSIA